MAQALPAFPGGMAAPALGSPAHEKALARQTATPSREGGVLLTITALLCVGLSTVAAGNPSWPQGPSLICPVKGRRAGV